MSMGSRGEKPVFLIVEDNDIVRTLIHDLIVNHFPESIVLEVENAPDGIKLACSERPDIILMDICLPQIDGIEATRRIKKESPQAKVVILSVHEDPEYEADATAAGANAFMLKRKMVIELIPLMENLLS